MCNHIYTGQININQWRVKIGRARDYFLAAYRSALDNDGIKQTEIFAATGIATQTLSAYYKGRKSPGIDQQELIANACGDDYLVFLQRGKEILEPEQPKSVLPDGYLSVGQVHGMTDDIDKSYEKLYARVKLWRAAFECLPVAALLIKDTEVVYQNKKSRAWGVSTGGPLCDSCIDSNCKGMRSDCAVRVALETGSEASEMRQIGDTIYKVDVMPLYQNAHEYFVVSAAVFSGEVHQ